MIKDPTKMYCAVRLEKEAGYEWLDTSTMLGGRETVVFNADKDDKQIPDWAAANPVQRIAPVEIREIEEA